MIATIASPAQDTALTLHTLQQAVGMAGTDKHVWACDQEVPQGLASQVCVGPFWRHTISQLNTPISRNVLSSDPNRGFTHIGCSKICGEAPTSCFVCHDLKIFHGVCPDTISLYAKVVGFDLNRPCWILAEIHSDLASLVTKDDGRPLYAIP